jgi:hypothetical protein
LKRPVAQVFNLGWTAEGGWLTSVCELFATADLSLFSLL